MAKKKGCKRAPIVKGELSELYLGIMKILTDQYKLEPHVARLLTNTMYVQYDSNNSIKDALDRAGVARNKQDEHEAMEVFNILQGSDMVNFADVNALNTLSITEGIKTGPATDVEFTDWKTAYTKAESINAANPILSASVVQKNGNFVVKVSNKTTLNMVDRTNTEIENAQMNLIENALQSKRLSLSDISYAQTKFFGKKYHNLVDWIKSTSLIPDPKYLMKEDLKMLISLHHREPIVDRLITKYGDIDTLVDTYYDWYRGNITVTSLTETQLKAAMDLMKSFNGLDASQLYTDSNSLTTTMKNNSQEYETQKHYDKLNSQFKLENDAIEASKDKLTSLSKIVAQSIKSLLAEAVALRAAGDKAASQDLYNRIKVLDRDLKQKENTSGIVDFLSRTASRLQELLNDVNTVIPPDADMKFIQERGTALRKANQFLQVYEPIVSSLVVTDILSRDMDISDTDIKVISDEAVRLMKTVSAIHSTIDDTMDAWAKQALSLMLVENSDVAIEDVLANMKDDATWFDRMYNATKVSHIPTAVLANYIQAARRQRTKKMVDIANRISAIINKLPPSKLKGHVLGSTEFIYDKVETMYSTKAKPQYEYQLLNPYDYNAFNKAQGKQMRALRKRGLTGHAFDAAMERWMFNNTQEIIVDHTTGRTERVPKMMKAVNPLDALSPEQRAAYDEFIALKGELDSMLPEFARSIFMPPQVRKNAIDKLTNDGVLSAVKEKFKQTFTIREDEVGMGIQETDSGDVIIQYTDITGNSNVIPINYVNKLSNQEELHLNFAEGISLLASSAINYDTMKEIVDTVEVLGDYIIDRVSPNKDGAKMAQGFTYGTTLYFEVAKTGKSSNVSDIIADLKKRLIYNDHTLANYSAKTTKVLAFVRKITSINALTFNLFGAINNALEGYRKNLEESLVYGTHTLDLIDLEYAHWKILKDHVGKSGSLLLDFFSGKRESLGAMIMDRFDPKKEKFHEIANRKYRTNLFRKAVSKDLTMIGYSIGETLNNMPIVYAMLHHIKVTIDGKNARLVDALERVPNGDGTYRLGIKANTVLRDSGRIVDEAYLDEVARKINEVSESNHGGMSEEAMGEIATTILGMMTLQLRRWMIGVYSNYFRGEYFDASTGRKREGAWKGIFDVTFAPMLADSQGHMPWSKEWKKDIKTFRGDLLLYYKNLKPHQKLAAVRWLTTTSLMTVLSILTDAFLKSQYPRHKDEEWFKVLYYLLARQKMDVSSTVPDLNHIERISDIGTSLIEIMDKPFASYSTVEMWRAPFRFYDIGEEIQQGPHKGEDKYWRNVRKNWWKPGELWDRIEGLEDTDELISSLGGLKGKYSAKKEYEKLTGKKVKDKKKKHKNKW